MSDKLAAGPGRTSDDALSLVAPEAVSRVTDEQAQHMVRIDPERSQQIAALVARYVGGLASLDPNSAEFSDKVKAIHSMGDREIRDSANVSNRLLDRPVKSLESGPFSENATVSKSLIELRHTVEDLDPARQGVLGAKRLFGLLPFGNRLRTYFARYQSAQGHLNAIINALYRGQDELRQDNAAIEQEKVNVWALKERLERYVYMADKLDEALAAEIDKLAQTDPEKAKLLREDALFYVRQKRQDLVTQLAVNAQGYLALELVRRNNLELIKGVDRATTTTVSALRTAVIIAQALTNQKLVLEQISALNVTTSELIESTSQVLKEQTGEVHAQAASAAVSVEKLQSAFRNLYATLDMIDTYKLQALESMQQTITALNAEVAQAQGYLRRAHAAPETQLLASRGELTIGDSTKPNS